jgi:hypothetical protein
LEWDNSSATTRYFLISNCVGVDERGRLIQPAVLGRDPAFHLDDVPAFDFVAVTTYHVTGVQHAVTTYHGGIVLQHEHSHVPEDQRGGGDGNTNQLWRSFLLSADGIECFITEVFSPEFLELTSN